MRQQKVEHHCSKCGGPVKRTIGAASRQKFWECLSDKCGARVKANPEPQSMDISDRWYPR